MAGRAFALLRSVLILGQKLVAGAAAYPAEIARLGGNPGPAGNRVQCLVVHLDCGHIFHRIFSFRAAFWIRL